MELDKIELGYNYTDRELKSCYRQIFGGVVWPGKNPGFAVVIGMGHKKHFGSHDIYLLDEFQSFDIRELVRKCGALNFRYQPAMWIGDDKNDAADRFVREANRESQVKESQKNYWWSSAPQRRRQFYVCPTPILDRDHPYPYIMSELKSLLDEDHRQLFLKDGMTANYLSGIEPEKVSTFEFGKFPAIEALAFAVTEMRHRASWSDNEATENTDIAQSYSYQGVL
jgi:hypothetical protein